MSRWYGRSRGIWNLEGLGCSEVRWSRHKKCGSTESMCVGSRGVGGPAVLQYCL